MGGIAQRWENYTHQSQSLSRPHQDFGMARTLEFPAPRPRRRGRKANAHPHTPDMDPIPVPMHPLSSFRDLGLPRPGNLPLL